jgi:hypothetical protein
MDSHQRQRALRSLLSQFKDPEAASLAKGLLCDQEAEEKTAKDEAGKGRLFLWLSLAFAFDLRCGLGEKGKKVWPSGGRLFHNMIYIDLGSHRNNNDP